ncbi:hypothetical protein L3C95_02555 [Chitinophaga filiformis]|uniref:hypothetical protein n=1 Tax=Chitinophaga filiformis TaxID=104663 RepID=UPI001F2B62CA|nr:hypothetical protein [Chitinophaga filiformis]MCF6401736.1 hypothetical protein [Chitinophaga filiformis]
MQPIVLICLSIALSVSCSTTRNTTIYDNKITSIENHLYAITASGKDTGIAQTVSQRMAALGIKGFANRGRGVVIMTNSSDATAIIREYVRSVSRVYGWPPMWNRE